MPRGAFIATEQTLADLPKRYPENSLNRKRTQHLLTSQLQTGTWLCAPAGPAASELHSQSAVAWDLCAASCPQGLSNPWSMLRGLANSCPSLSTAEQLSVPCIALHRHRWQCAYCIHQPLSLTAAPHYSEQSHVMRRRTGVMFVPCAAC